MAERPERNLLVTLVFLSGFFFFLFNFVYVRASARVCICVCAQYVVHSTF